MDFPVPYIYQTGSGTIIPIERLSDYVTKNGVVIPQTSSIKATIENMMKEIFGADMSIEPETPVGRLVDTITFLFIDVLGVNAQNANNFNPEIAIGSYLDSLGKLWGVERYENEKDADYRSRILESQSRGSGFPQSIRSAISQVVGNHASVVLNNGHKDVAILPDSDRGVPVDGHSVYVCADCDDTTDAKEAVARAIYNTVSAGCGFTDSEFGHKVEVDIEDSAGAITTVRFYRPIKKSVTIEATVKPGSYTGTDIVAATKNAITNYVGEHTMNCVITKDEIVSAIAGNGSGIICTGISLFIGTTQVDRVILRPCEVIDIDADGITVNV